MLSRAARTKTTPRHWAASVLGATPAGDGWLQACLALLQRAHADDWDSADHLGKMAAADRQGWLRAPAE
eukprot:4651974-Alexandrium_andersonii.AAC.1